MAVTNSFDFDAVFGSDPLLLDNFASRALYMAERGVEVIPVNGKAAFIPNWDVLATRDAQEINKWAERYPNANVGIVARPHTIWLLDVDDTRIVREYEQDTGLTFPQTFAVQSRDGRGHFYFKPTDASRKLGNVAQSEVQDRAFSVRACNQYVVGPGSIHPDTNQPYRVVQDMPFVPVPDALIEWIKGRVTKDKKHKPGATTEKVYSGERNSKLTSIAGRLRHAGLSADGLRDELLRKNTELCVPPLDDNEVLRIAESVARYPAQETGTAASIVGEVTTEDEPEIVDEPLPDFPVIPGNIGELADAVCPDLSRKFKVMAAVTRIGLMLSGRVQLEGELHLQPRFYTCMIGPPHSGKTAANNEIGRLFVSGDFLSVPSVDSGPALVDAFKEVPIGPSRLLLNPDELRDVFEKAKVSKESRNTIASELLKLFEANTTGNRSRKHNVVEVSNAHLAIIGGAPPKVYEEMWLGTGGAASGLQSRFTLVTTDKKMPEVQGKWSPEEVDGIMKKIRAQIQAAPKIIRTSDEALALFRDWWRSTDRDKPSEARIADIVKRFLMVLAVTNSTGVIDPLLMRIGIAFGEYQIACREKFNPDDASGWVQAFEQRIVKAYRKHGEMTDNQLRRLISPEKSKGGYGPYLQALKNLRSASVVIQTGRTERAAKYAMADGRLQTE